MAFPQLARRRFQQALFVVVGSAWLSWFCDGIVQFAAREADPWSVLRGWFLALFSFWPVAALAGAALGVLYALPALLHEHGEPHQPPIWLRVRVWLAPAELALRRRRSAVLYALSGLALLYVVAWRVIAEHVVVAFARPEYSAAALLGVQLALLLVAACLFAPLHAAIVLTLSRLARALRVIDGFFARPDRVVALLLGLVALSVLAFVYVNAEALSYLPIAELLRVLLATLLALAFVAFTARIPELVKRGALMLVVASVVGASLHALAARPDSTQPYKIAQQEMLTGRSAHMALQLLLDWDHDGYLPFVPPFDCAPRNPDIHPGGLEIPDNGVDEDCDGKDVDARPLPARGRADYALEQAVEARPPIIFITVDVLTARALGQLGGRADLMPRLSAYAQRSALFTQCFAQGPSTRLSFPSIFTSRWDSQIGHELSAKHPHPIKASESTLAEALDELGYDTVAITSDAYFSAQRWPGLLQGFDRTIEDPFRASPRIPHTAERVAAAISDELGRPRSAPLFVWAHFYDAHSPHDAFPGTPEKAKSDPEALYEAELSHIDGVLGPLLATIESSFGGRAVVVITGDHGSAFDPPRHEKRHYGYDLATSVLHVPLIVHAPWVAPRSLGAPVSTMDIMPTLLNVVRYRRRKLAMQGMSLVPELTTGRASRPPELLHEMFLIEREWKKKDPLTVVALRTDRFNLTLDRDTGSYELYDYRADYFEQNDLANQPFYRSDFVALRDQLSRYLALAAPRVEIPEPPAGIRPQRGDEP